MNTWVVDQAARAGRDGDVFADRPQTMSHERPMLPPPHQVAAELVEGLYGQAVTSKRSLVYHGWVTL